MKFISYFKKIKNNYCSLTFAEKFIIWLRFKFAPLELIMRQIPSEGKLLDLGCGFGVFSYLFAFERPRLKILGIDPSGQRIERAKKVLAMPGNLEFRQGFVENLNDNNFDAITLIDVVYYLSEEQQIKILASCYERMRNGGILIIKTMDKSQRFKYFFMSLIAKINTAISWFAAYLPKKFTFSLNKIYGQRKTLPKLYRWHPKLCKGKL